MTWKSARPVYPSSNGAGGEGPDLSGRPRVLLCALSFGEGLGGAALSASLVARMLAEDCEVGVLTAANYSTWPGVRELRIAGQRAAVPMLLRLPTAILGLRRDVERAIREFQPDLIHLQDQDLVDPVVPVANRLGIPVAVTLRDDRFARSLRRSRRIRSVGPPAERELSLLRNSRSFLDLVSRKRPLTWGLPLALPLLFAKPARVRRLLAQATHLLPLSDYIAREVRRCGIRTPQHIIPLSPMPEWDAAPLRAKPEPCYLTVSRLVRGKGVAVLLEAFAEVKKRLPRARLVIAGTGPEEKNLRALARKLRVEASVEFRGNVKFSQTRALYVDADIVVFPTLMPEALGRVVIEAMTVGRPVIASRVGGVPEILDEDCGVLVEPGNAGELAGEMLALAMHRARQQRLVRAARVRARDFRESHLRPQVLAFYSFLLGRPATELARLAAPELEEVAERAPAFEPALVPRR